MPTNIDASYQVVTPLFCAGVDPARPELRLPSFKGVLRFWWRTLAWSRCQGDLRVIQREEDALFGSANGGQSGVSMRLVPHSEPRVAGKGEVLRMPGTQRPVGEGARYLGFGVMEAFASRNKGTAAGQLTRACLCAPLDFTVRMRGRNLNETQSQSLKEALAALGTLGSMGSKSRKGYGSLTLQSLSVDGAAEWSAPESMSDLMEEIKKIRHAEATTDLPAYTAFSRGTRHVLVSGNEIEPLSLLDRIGRELVRFRSWGHNGKVLGQVDSERLFEDDHDLMKGAERSAHPRRIAFGLPHNYGSGRNQQVGPAAERLDRRASPMFIHLQLCGTAPVAVISFLPSRFLPEGRSTISVGDHKVAQAPEQELYEPVHEFLDRLLDPDKRKEPFTKAVEV